MGSGSSVTEVGSIERVIPKWINTAKTKPEFLFDELFPLSKGFQSINSNTIVRFRRDERTIDIARWTRGFTNGRHIFEVAFSCHKNRTHASIGVGMDGAFGTNFKRSMIGDNDKTWGIHLDTRKSCHKGMCVKRYPTSPNKIPDRFYMYLNLDKGCLEFGSDSTFYGYAIQGIDPGGSPLYPMVTAAYTGAIVTMIYRGVGKESRGPLRRQ